MKIKFVKTKKKSICAPHLKFTFLSRQIRVVNVDPGHQGRYIHILSQLSTFGQPEMSCQRPEKPTGSPVWVDSKNNSVLFFMKTRF